MITKIELNNFQSHKHTVVDFTKNVNAILGESDNGKTAIIRAMRWVIENRPSGTDKLNSNWNSKFKEPMSVKLYTDSGWVERIRDKDRNGYNIYSNGELKEYSAIGTDVPKDVSDFLKISDVNVQYQFDSPYLISMTANEASKYLNNIIHLDIIDDMLSLADSNKRSLNSEDKIVDKDIEELSRNIESLSWLDDANAKLKRIDKYEELTAEKSKFVEKLQNSLFQWQECSHNVYDYSKEKELISKIESVEIKDITSFEQSLVNYKNAEKEIKDYSKEKEVISKIESLDVSDKSIIELEDSIKQYTKLSADIENSISEINELKLQLGDVCPYCGSKLDKEKLECLQEK